MDQTNQKFSVEKGYDISLIFFLSLWTLIEPEIKVFHKSAFFTNVLFFHEVCSGFEVHAEWNESVYRVKKIPKENQKSILLSESEVFLCALEFCKLFNERFESQLPYTVNLLEGMQKDPNFYNKEWSLWKNAIDRVMNQHKTLGDFDWSAELP